MSNRIRRCAPILALALILSLVAAGVVWAANDTLSRQTVLSTAGQVSSGHLSVHTAVGQPIVGTVQSGDVVVCSGVNCPAGVAITIPGPAGSSQLYLPTLGRP